MSNALRCKSCNSENVRWVTMRRDVPVDVLQCQQCGTAQVEEDWVPPLLPLIPGKCLNCGGTRDRRGVCANCGLDQHEDRQVHDELRQVVSPRMSMLQAGREANRQGRRLIALKLATAAAASNEEGQGEIARGLRIWLLAAIGEAQSALDDAKAWVEHQPDASAYAWACLGAQYQHAGFPGSAADAFGKALAKDPTQHIFRAKRASLLLQMRREGQASEEATTTLETEGIDDQTAAIALEVVEEIAQRMEQQVREDEVERLLEKSGIHVQKSAKLLAQRARIAAMNGDLAQAKRDLKAAKALNPDLEDQYEKIERLLKPQRTSWWRW